MSKKIKVTVDTKGAIKVAPEGYEGQACHDATRALEDALGTRGASADTDEAYLEGEQGVEASL